MRPSSTCHRPSRIAFGSCNNQNMTSPLWSVIESRDPAAFVWSGDAVYADYEGEMDFGSFPPYTESIEATPKVLDEAYAKQLQNPEYISFLRNSNNITIFGTYDDHDFGVNNGDKTYKHAKHAAVAFLKFTGEPKASPMYKRAEKGYGLYGVKMFDFNRPTGKELMTDAEAAVDPDVIFSRNSSSYRGVDGYLEKTVAIFVLDCRTNKTPWGAVTPDFEGDMLGERQWRWFEAAIKNSRAEVNVIVNGLQVHPDVRPSDPNIYERWGAFPIARQRLYDAILQDGVKAPILISGDVHMSQLMRKDCYKWDPSSHRMLPTTSRRALIELTTSGMTHSWGTCTSTQLKHHHSWHAFFSHIASKYIMEFAHLIVPMKDILISPVGNSIMARDKDKLHHRDINLFENGGAENARKGLQYSLDLNFGELEFDWERKTVTVRTLGKDSIAPPLIAAKYHFDQLSGASAFPGGEEGLQEMMAKNKSVSWNAWSHNLVPVISRLEQRPHQWTCIDHRGTVDPLRITISYASLAFVLMGLPLILILGLIGLFRRKLSHLIVGVITDIPSPMPKNLISGRAM